MAEVWLKMSGYCGFSTRTTHFTRLPIAASARSTLYETHWIVKSDRMKNEKQTLWCLDWRPSDVLAAGLTLSGCWNQVLFFPISLARRRNITKNPFYACYEWPLVSASWALGSGRKKTGDLGMWWRKRWSHVVVRGGDGKQMKRKMIRCCDSQGRKE